MKIESTGLHRVLLSEIRPLRLGEEDVMFVGGCNGSPDNCGCYEKDGGIGYCRHKNFFNPNNIINGKNYRCGRDSS